LNGIIMVAAAASHAGGLRLRWLEGETMADGREAGADS